MKSGKRILAFLAAVLLGLSACSSDASVPAGTPAPSVGNTEIPAEKEEREGFAIALVTDQSRVDNGGTNQNAWEGVSAYAQEHEISHNYYPSDSDSEEDCRDAVAFAIEGGAELVIACGGQFERVIDEMQSFYGDVTFLLLDEGSEPVEEESGPGENVMHLRFREEEAGFLAGYAAVMDGLRTLGIQGKEGSVRSARFGHGFLQGAEAAAEKLSLETGVVSAYYHDAAPYEAEETVGARAALWYENGAEVIFVCDGGMMGPVIQAAEATEGKWVIGAESDRSASSERVLTSAVLSYGNAVRQVLGEFYQGNWKGDCVRMFGLAEDGLGLSMETGRLRLFSGESYAAVCNDIVQTTYIVRGDVENILDLGLERVTALQTAN